MRQKFLLLASIAAGVPVSAFANESEIRLPELGIPIPFFGHLIGGDFILIGGMLIAFIGLIYGVYEFLKIKKLPAHGSMTEVSELIYETCKSYLAQQGKLLIFVQSLTAGAMFYYFYGLLHMELPRVFLILFWSVLGVMGSLGVAWFGIRVNNYANSRAAFASLRGMPYPVMDIPLRAGMSIGVLLICVEVILMIAILLFVPSESKGACFLGFAIGESLGAAVLRVCGGIFTKIADIGADLMKIAFNIKEDDARNPGVIADCAGDNAGDSVGPTADGFETYGVTGVALISFICLAGGMVMESDGKITLALNGHETQAKLIVWLFARSALMVVTSVAAYLINGAISRARFETKTSFDFEAPLTSLVWLSSMIAIIATYILSYAMFSDMGEFWWRLSTIMSCGTLAAALIPELTKVFTSSKSEHVAEIVSSGREGGASLVIISGLVAGNFSAFWKGMAMVGLMAAAYMVSSAGLNDYMVYPSVFAFGLVAFGFLGMAPITIAVDSYGPVTDNAQSVFELSVIEQLPNIVQEVEKDFGFKPNFAVGKRFLEENDSAGNTFKATSKPVLIGTAVIGATTMIFSIILLLNLKLDLLDARVLLGMLTGGAVIYWFSGASMQAVGTGAFRAVEFIKANIKLDSEGGKASLEDSKAVVRICTKAAQDGMVWIFAVVFCFTLAFACFDATFFASYLISLAAFGLFQAMFMANAGGAWDNAKKVVEVDLREKGSALHSATVVGDTVGDPFKDTSSVALNPIIKFTTLFGLLAVEIAVSSPDTARYFGVGFFLAGLYFVYCSFYKMRVSRMTVMEAAADAKKKQNSSINPVHA